MSASPIMDHEHTTSREGDNRPRPANNHWGTLYEGDMDIIQPTPCHRQPQAINNHWGTLYEGDVDTSRPTPRRGRPQALNNHWGTLYEGDMDTIQPTPRRRQPKSVNNHWATLFEGDLDAETTQPTPRRPRPQATSSHWGTLFEGDLVADSDQPAPDRRLQNLFDGDVNGQASKPTPTTQHTTEPPNPEKKAKKRKVNRYSLKKPNFPKSLPLALQVKYRPPTNVAVIVLPEFTDQTFPRVARPGANKPARSRSPLSEVISADDL